MGEGGRERGAEDEHAPHHCTATRVNSFGFCLYKALSLLLSIELQSILSLPPHELDRHREWVLAYALRGDDGADHAFKRHVRIDLLVVHHGHAVAH